MLLPRHRHETCDLPSYRLQVCLERCDVCGSLLVRKSYKAVVLELSGRHLTMKISPKQVPLAAVCSGMAANADLQSHPNVCKCPLLTVMVQAYLPSTSLLATQPVH